MDVVHEYPDIKVHLTLFNAIIAKGVPQKLEHNDIQWISFIASMISLVLLNCCALTYAFINSAGVPCIKNILPVFEL